MLEVRDSKPTIAERLAARAAAWPACRSPFGVLCHTFFAQFFSSDIVTSDMRLRQAMIGVLGFLLVPGVMMMGDGITLLSRIEFRARLLHASGMIEPVLAYLAASLISYSMATVSFIAVLEWDALGFDQRDAMVLGPLPIRGATIVGAKLAALGALLVVVAGSINLIPTVAFAYGTVWLLGPIESLRYLAAYMAATIGVAVFVFLAIVAIRGTIALAVGAHLAVRFGALLKFLFAGALLAFVIVRMTSGSNGTWVMFFELGDWMPSGWFLALFERIRGSTQPDLVARAGRAIAATTIALAGAVFVSILGFTRQSRLALAPSASVGAFAGARIGRTLVRLMTAGEPVACATADFILQTLARCRAQQELIAINTALGAAVVIGGLARNVPDLASLARPRTAVLWIPLVLAYSLTIGLRAAFFVPSELPGSWTFRVNGPERTTAYWSATRSSMIAFVVPPTALATVAILVPLLGWRMAAIHTMSACVVAIFVIELVALTVSFVPFTRAYAPGHANLKSLWWVYALGLFTVAYWPARIHLSSIENPGPLFQMTATLAIAIGALDIVGRRRATRWREPWPDAPEDDLSTVTVLNIGTITSAHAQQLAKEPAR